MNTDHVETLMKQKGIDVEKLAKALKIQYLLYDVASLYTFEVESILKNHNMFRHRDKFLLNRIKTLHSQLTKSLDKDLSTTELMEKFGDTADFLQKAIDILIDIENENDRTKVLSTLKLIRRE